MDAESTSTKHTALGIVWVVAAAGLYQFARAAIPLTIVILVAFVALWYGVRRGAKMVALGIADKIGERPYLIAIGLVAAAFLTASFVDYLVFDLALWHSGPRELPSGTGFFEFVELRAQSGYGEILGGELVAGGWPTIAVWVAWSGLLALAALAGVGKGLRERRNTGRGSRT